MVTVTRMLKIRRADHFDAVVTSLSHLRDLKVIQEKLTLRQQRLFKRICLGYFLEIDADLTFSGNYVQHMIMHEVEIDEAPYELWFVVRGTTTKFLWIEFMC